MTELKRLEGEMLRREKSLKIDLLEQIPEEIRLYCESLNIQSAEKPSQVSFVVRLWVWTRAIILRLWNSLLNGRKRKENHF